MRPVLFTAFGVDVPSYAVFVILALFVALLVRRAEKRRLGVDPRAPSDRVVAIAALIGAVIGSKLGMVLFATPEQLSDLWDAMTRFDLSGKTVVGGVAGGWLGVEIAKKIAGIKRRTGDVFALALPLGIGVGRIGCFFNGCCYGSPSNFVWSVDLHGALRHPAPLYESVLLFAFAAALWLTRERKRAPGRLFRESVLGVCVIRFTVEVFRGDPSWTIGPLSAPQLVCAAAIVAIAIDLSFDRRRVPPYD